MSSPQHREDKHARDIASIQQTMETMGSDITELAKAFTKIQEQMEPVLELYKGGVFAKTFIIGTATFVGSIVALGATVLWVIDYLKHPS